MTEGDMKTCLVVDDSKVVRMVARKILEGLSFEVAEAEDGKAALARCVARMPDAILLDWNMPVMNGIDFLRRLPRVDGGAEPVVVFCTTAKDFSFIQGAPEARLPEERRDGQG